MLYSWVYSSMITHKQSDDTRSSAIWQCHRYCPTLASHFGSRSFQNSFSIDVQLHPQNGKITFYEPPFTRLMITWALHGHCRNSWSDSWVILMYSLFLSLREVSCNFLIYGVCFLIIFVVQSATVSRHGRTRIILSLLHCTMLLHNMAATALNIYR